MCLCRENIITFTYHQQPDSCLGRKQGVWELQMRGSRRRTHEQQKLFLERRTCREKHRQFFSLAQRGDASQCKENQIIVLVLCTTLHRKTKKGQSINIVFNSLKLEKKNTKKEVKLQLPSHKTFHQYTERSEALDAVYFQ